MQTAAMELVAKSVAASDYEGWVAYLADGVPIYERVRHDSKRLSVIAGGIEMPFRGTRRDTMEWKDLPMRQVWRVELYWGRRHWKAGEGGQPVCQIDRIPGDSEFRFIQYKKTSQVVQTSHGRAAAPPVATSGRFQQVHSDMSNAARVIREIEALTDYPTGQARTGLHSYVLGYYTKRPPGGSGPVCELIEFTKNGERKDLGVRVHPCWPRKTNLGFGLHPSVLGLTEADVPEVPIVTAVL